MASSILLTVTVADFLEWNDKSSLKLNPNFQRRSVWTTAARSFLIDTLLRQLPVPKIYLRTQIDLKTRNTVREVVDGQQRLRAIIDFASNSFSLDKRAKEFAGLTYGRLDDELKTKFLSYTFGVDQLINASDNEVLEIFSRLNSYNVKLNAAELRHGEFQGDFKWSVHETAQRWSALWENFQIISLSRRARMLDDELMAQMFGIVSDGIVDGNQTNIRNLYKKYNDDFTKKEEVIYKVDDTINFIMGNLSEAIIGPIANPPHFLILFAAVSHALYGIPQGSITNMPQREENALSDRLVAIDNLTTLSAVIADPDPPLSNKFLPFWRASKSSTTRISSRSIRFPVYYRALFPQPL